MADGIAIPTLTQTITECWVYHTSSDVVYSTPAEPVASGAECFRIFPTGGGVEMSPIPASEVSFTSEPPPTHSSSSSVATTSNTSSHTVVGPVVGSVVGILVMTIPIMWYISYRQRRKRMQEKKHEWAMKPGKWTFNEQKKEQPERDSSADIEV